MKGKLKKIILWSITAIVAISASVFCLNNYTNVKAEEFIDGKDLKENGDGTYELSLSVTGESEKKVNKANVIVILDISGSMEHGTSYTQNNRGGYGYVNGEYVFLYNSSGNRIGNNTYNATVKDGAIETINNLSNNNNIYIITARGNSFIDDIEKLINEYLKKYNIKYNKIITNAGDKLDACMDNKIDIMIDDNYYNYSVLKENNIKCLLFDDKNRYLDNSDRVSCWEDVVKYLMK